MDSNITFVEAPNQLFTTIVVFSVGVVIAVVVVLFVIDMAQTQDAVR